MAGLVSAGFHWVTPFSPVAGHPADLRSISCGEHCSLSLPGPWCFTWMGIEDEEREHHARRLGVPDVAAAMAFAAREFAAERIGYPAVLLDRSVADQARQLAVANAPLRLLQIGVSEPRVTELLAETTPAAGHGTTGFHLALARRQPVTGGRLLGYELVALSFGVLSCSYRCNALREPLEARFGVHFDEAGLLPDEQAAWACADALTRQEVPAEPLFWIAAGLIEHT